MDCSRHLQGSIDEPFFVAFFFTSPIKVTKIESPPFFFSVFFFQRLHRQKKDSFSVFDKSCACVCTLFQIELVKETCGTGYYSPRNATSIQK